MANLIQLRRVTASTAAGIVLANGEPLWTTDTFQLYIGMSGTNYRIGLSLNGLAGSTQTFAVGTTGSAFNISSSGTVHTFNMPAAGASANGVITTGTQTIAGAKTFSGNIVFSGSVTGGPYQPLFDHYADGASTHTDGTEDTLYTDTLAAGQLANNGEKIEVTYTITIAGHALSTDRIQAYFAGTNILDSGSNTFASGGTANIWIRIIRVSGGAGTGVVRISAEFVPAGITLQPVVKFTEISGLTLTNTAIVKVTGIASGTGAAAGDITAKLGNIVWIKAS